MNRWKVALAPAEPAYPNDAGRRLPPGAKPGVVIAASA